MAVAGVGDAVLISHSCNCHQERRRCTTGRSVGVQREGGKTAGNAVLIVGAESCAVRRSMTRRIWQISPVTTQRKKAKSSKSKDEPGAAHPRGIYYYDTRETNQLGSAGLYVTHKTRKKASVRKETVAIKLFCQNRPRLYAFRWFQIQFRQEEEFKNQNAILIVQIYAS